MRSTACMVSTNGIFSTGKTPISVAGCVPVATTSGTCRVRRRFTRVGQSSKTLRARAIRAFHDSAYLYYETHVAPDSGLKRWLARVLLSLRCWLLLRFSAHESSRPHGATAM